MKTKNAEPLKPTKMPKKTGEFEGAGVKWNYRSIAGRKQLGPSKGDAITNKEAC